MDRISEWRPIEGADSAPRTHDASVASPARPWLRWAALALAGSASLSAIALALWATSPQPQIVLADLATLPSGSAPAASRSPGAPAPAAAALVVDVEGAVVRAGLYELPADSRVGDAIAAAGGYGPTVDIEAAAQQLNLAARLNDGDKVLVPRLGASVPGPDPAGTDDQSRAPTGPIDINSASEAALDTLPGVGPVTAARIIAARAEAPFTSVDELLARGVVGAATLDKIRPLVSVGP